MSKGKKFQKLARYDLVPPKAEWLLAEAFGRGCEKYPEKNFLNGYEWSKSYQAMRRHLTQWWAGERCSEDNNVHHLASVMWHCAVLLEFEDLYPELDDRPRKLKLETEIIDEP